jgi:hypothetical protein
MADIDLQGRKPEDIPAVTENPNPEKTVNVEKTPVPEAGRKLKETPSGVELRPTMHVQGNELIVLVQVLSSINRNLAFLARTVHEFAHKDDVKKNG